MVFPVDKKQCIEKVTMKRSLAGLAILCALFATVEAVIHELPISVPQNTGFFSPSSKTITVYLRNLKPSGFEVWTDDTSLIDMLSIQCDRLSHTRHNKKKWEPIFTGNSIICRDGEFRIINYNLVTKNNETIECRASVRQEGELFYSNGRFTWYTGDSFDKAKDLSDCITSQPTEYLFFPIANATLYVADHKRFVETRLFNIDDLTPLAYNVAETYVVQHGVVAKMKTVRDKCTVLVLGKSVLDVFDSDSSGLQTTPTTHHAKGTPENTTESKHLNEKELNYNNNNPHGNDVSGLQTSSTTHNVTAENTTENTVLNKVENSNNNNTTENDEPVTSDFSDEVTTENGLIDTIEIYN